MGPLAHARVLELGSTIAGPFCGRLLADFGADVVKVEPPSGDPDRPPARVAVSLTDYITGLYAAFGIAMALIHRDRTDEGQVIDANLMESAFSFMEPHVPAYDQLAHIANRAGSRLPNVAPNGLFETRDGRHIHIAASGQPVFRRLCKAMAREDLLADERFSTPRARGAHLEALEAIVQAWVGQHDLAPLEKLLVEDADVPATRIYTMADIFADPHYAARGTLARVPHNALGEIAMTQVAPRLSLSPGEIRWPGRPIGADTRAVLSEKAGYDAARIDDLTARGVIVDAASQ
jgi:crotonobetainyl-CoA:carnitine CoA-transferase CaiB-like acyl-CoA transferase